MSVRPEDVLHVAKLARLGIADDRLAALANELSGILDHMDVLARVDTSAVAGSGDSDDRGTPLRPDAGPPIPLYGTPESFAPEMRDGFFLVPRLATHGDDVDRAP